ncbi:MAG: hypothetical protein HY578_01770 [Nitrospinae bacterium]|nr:hypothetical protein [Nitrospinota bacterium]
MHINKVNDLSADKMLKLHNSGVLEKIAKDVKTKLGAGVLAVYFLISGCASISKNYKMNGIPSNQPKAEDKAKEKEKGWWSENWPYVVIPAIIIGVIIAIPKGGSSSGGGGGY